MRAFSFPRPRRFTISLLASLGLFFGLYGAVLAVDTAPAYQIVLERPDTVGEHYTITFSGTDQYSMTYISGGKVVDKTEDTFSVQIDAVVQVLEVDAKQTAQKESLTITRCVKIVDKQEIPLADNGTVITSVVKENKKAFTINDAPVSKDLRKALIMCFGLPVDKPTDDELFGTAQPRHVGERWNINAEKMARSLTIDKVCVAAKDVTGQTILKEALVQEGIPCLRIITQIKITNAKPTGLPAGLKLKSLLCTMSFSDLLPVDTRQQCLEDQSQFTMQMVAAGKPEPDAPEITMKVDAKHTETTKYGPAQ